MKTYYYALFVCLLTGIILMVNACSIDDDTNTAAASFKLETTQELFSISVLSSIKSAISRNSPQTAFKEFNRYLVNYQFTDSNGSIMLPKEITTTLCTGPTFNSSGKLTRNGDIQSGDLLFENFCHRVTQPDGAIVNLIVNGTIGYTTDVAANELKFSYDIFTTFELEKHLYFGDVTIDLSNPSSINLINRYIDTNAVIYNTDQLRVSGNINQGYSVDGNIIIGDQGSIGVQTIVPINYGGNCGATLEKGKINVTLTDIEMTITALFDFCQIEICSSAKNSIIESCTTINPG